MAVAHVNFLSQALHKEVAFCALLPDRQGKAGPFPTFYLLHGLSDDYTAWLRWSSIELYVRELPLIVVLPDGDRWFYCDASHGPAYETALVQDLVGFVDQYFPTETRGPCRAIGGLSMGGYGAMKIGLKYPELFCSISAHSGVHAMCRNKEPKDFDGAWRRIWGTKKAIRENDPFLLAEKLDPETAPSIWIDCGVDDALIDDNRQLHKHLRKLGIAHEYHEFPGGHTWPYWDEHVQEAIDFHREALGV
jgi:S-formylglutathione hydrolase FrmB